MSDSHTASVFQDYNETTSTSSPILVGKGPHIDKVPLQSISKFAPYSALILCIIVVIYFVIRFYILERFLLRRIYGKTYTQMDETTRRGFVNHHIAGGTKVAILVLAAYPFIDVAFLTATLHSPYAGSKYVTMGDILIVAAQALIAMYVFELFYRPKISPVSVGHHIGTIMIGQSAIAISLNLTREKDATIEFILCLVWGKFCFAFISNHSPPPKLPYYMLQLQRLTSAGAFDIISEFLPHISIILYRVYPTDHKFLRNLFQISAITTLTGTTTETILIFYLWGSLWDRWTLAFRVTTPLLHILFAAAQLWGSFVFYKMYKKQCSIIAKKAVENGDVEAAPKTEGEAVMTTEEDGATTTEEDEAKSGKTMVDSKYSTSQHSSETNDNRLG
jgi:hypothetical protein